MSENENQGKQEPMAETVPEVGKVNESIDQVIPEVEVETWDKADLTMVCGQCGYEETITEVIGGVTLFMSTNSEAETKLVCSECKATMSLLYRNGSMLTKEEKEALKVEQAEKSKLTVVPDDESISKGKDEPKEESK